MHESEKWKSSHSVVSDSSRLHGLQPIRFLHPWDFPWKSTGVGCHCLHWSITLPWAIGAKKSPTNYKKLIITYLILRHLKSKVFSRIFTPLFSAFYFKIETPGTEKWVGDLNNTWIESHLKLGALLVYNLGECIIPNAIIILFPLILCYTRLISI